MYDNTIFWSLLVIFDFCVTNQIGVLSKIKFTLKNYDIKHRKREFVPIVCVFFLNTIHTHTEPYLYNEIRGFICHVKCHRGTFASDQGVGISLFYLKVGIMRIAWKRSNIPVAVLYSLLLISVNRVGGFN